jgi:hypothetical protein
MSNDRAKAIAKARSIAINDLISLHRQEWTQCLEKAYTDAGLVVMMRERSKEMKIQRLKAQIEALESAD